MNMLQAAAARIACVTALGALLASCGGSFSSDSSDSRLEGRFHGDRHQGAGGVFEHGTIVGAFGASRD